MHSGVNADDFGIFTSNSKGISIGNNDKSLVVIHPTDGIEFHTNNTNRFNITTAGNFQLLGTTVIDASRNLANIGTYAGSGDITLSSGNIALASSTPMVVASNGSGQLRLGAGGSEKMRIDSSGNVGIGTSSPSSIFTSLRKYDPTITLDDSGTAATIKNASGNIYYNTSSVNRDHIFQGAGTEKIRLTGDGLLGIGTDSPSLALEVNDTSNVDGEQISIKGSASYGGTVVFRRGDSFNWRVGVGGGQFN